MRSVLIFVCAVAVFTFAASAQPEPGPHSALEARVNGLRARLEMLRTTDAGAYFRLGEEVAQEGSDFASRRLAVELFVLALALDRRGSASGPSVYLPDRPSVGASACLALAAMAESEEQRRWLSALAATLGGDAGIDPAPAQATQASRDPAALELATVLGWLRAGEGRRAARLLEKPGVSALLDKCDKLLNPIIGGGAERVRRLVDQYPLCAQCRNRRYVKGPEGVALCPTCRGMPGVRIGQAEIIGQLRTESVLLSGVQRSWAAQVVADSGAPLRDLDPAEVASAFAVDVSKPLWRDGRWVMDPNAPAPVRADPPPADAPLGEPQAIGEGAPVTGTGKSPSSAAPRP